MQKLFSIPLDATGEPGATPIRRSILSPSALLKIPAEGVETLCDVLEYSAATYKDKRAMGYRITENIFHDERHETKIVNGVETKQTRIWTTFQLSGYHYYTYKEAAAIAKQLGAGLRKLGLSRGEMLHIFATTSAEWMLLAHGAFTQAIPIVTAYDTLGADGLLHSMNETGTIACFVNHDQLGVIEGILPSCPALRHIIYRGTADQAQVDSLKNVAQINNVLSYNELLALGKGHPVDAVKPSSEDICCIMYTSGTTGNPKGVVLKHGNVVAGVAGVCGMLQHLVEPDDSMMAYLPLAHVLEFLVENLCIFLGVTLGYGTIRTLTDVSVRNCKGDLQEFAPSIMTGVPQVFETIRKTILGKVAERGPRIEAIFSRALDLKGYLKERGLPTGFLDRIVFKNVKQQLGGRLRYCLSGGAPLASDTQRFLSLCLAPILGGYGMTESMCAVMAPEQFAYGEVGSPVPCVEVKLVDAPELGYHATNTPRAQGEIWIRGPSVTSGYYKQESLTKEALTEDGWLRTGDIGEWTERGTLAIIDRKKNLIKLSNGEYIALEKVESIYKAGALVENICLHVDSLYPRPVALVVPVEKQLRALATANGLDTNDWEALCENKTMRQLVLKQMHSQGKSAGLKAAELVHDIWICKDLWTSEMGLLTAAQKLKRREISEKYSQQLKELLSTLKK